MPIDAHTGLLAFFAHPCGHSKSPLMHNAACSLLGLNYTYLAFDVDEHTLPDAIAAMRALHIRGANLSMPNKEAVIPYLDELAPEAELIGAVNTIVNENGRLIGRNTDGAGWLRGIREAEVPLTGNKITVVGSGGAAKALLAEAATAGQVGEISVFNRKSARWPHALAMVHSLSQRTGCPIHLYQLNNDDPACRETLRREIAQSVLLVNATNVGMGVWAGKTWLPDADFLHPDLTVSDVIYNPAETELLRIAKAAGCKTQNGGAMVLYQGAISFQFWTGKEMPVEQIRPLLGL